MITASELVPPVGGTVTFDASLSGDPDGSIVSYEWDFDDGTTARGARVSHTFTVMDDFKVLLTVTDNSSLKGKADQRIFVGRPRGWTGETHHKSTDGRYDLLFDSNRVQRIDIRIDPEVYRIMEEDVADFEMFSGIDPLYAPVTVQYNGYTWWNVGMRYKGNSTLKMSLQQGHKLPFRLNFDKFEEDFPEINNQRFYGFSEMIFSNNWYDASFLREKVCADIFRNGGVPAARSAFFRVFVDNGSGPVYWGLYTMIEDPSDEMLKVQFDDNDGNLYKPEGEAAAWTSFSEEAFVKKTNKEAADWSDVRAAIDALHVPRDEAASWRAGLEAVFDAGAFIRWLAVNTAVVNWDSYGIMPQNYYLYQNLADNGRLVWFPWDLNMSMDPNSVSEGGVLTLTLNEVGPGWPLIRYLMDDPVYNALYHQELENALLGCMNEAVVVPYMRQLHQMIRPYTVGDQGEISGYTFLTRGIGEFDFALQTLIEHIRDRNTQVRNYLNSR